MPQTNIHASRAEALQNVESTIAELGGIFQQLATMVADQVRKNKTPPKTKNQRCIHALGSKSFTVCIVIVLRGKINKVLFENIK